MEDINALRTEAIDLTKGAKERIDIMFVRISEAKSEVNTAASSVKRIATNAALMFTPGGKAFLQDKMLRPEQLATVKEKVAKVKTELKELEPLLSNLEEIYGKVSKN